MVMEDNESCGSKASDTSPLQSRQQRQKLNVCNEVLRRLREFDNEEANRPGFDDELWTHFNRLPTRYISHFFLQTCINAKTNTTDIFTYFFLYLSVVIIVFWLWSFYLLRYWITDKDFFFLFGFCDSKNI